MNVVMIGWLVDVDLVSRAGYQVGNTYKMHSLMHYSTLCPNRIQTYTATSGQFLNHNNSNHLEQQENKLFAVSKTVATYRDTSGCDFEHCYSQFSWPYPLVGVIIIGEV